MASPTWLSTEQMARPSLKIPPVPLETSGSVLSQWRKDAMALAGYETIMLIIAYAYF